MSSRPSRPRVSTELSVGRFAHEQHRAEQVRCPRPSTGTPDDVITTAPMLRLDTADLAPPPAAGAPDALQTQRGGALHESAAALQAVFVGGLALAAVVGELVTRATTGVIAAVRLATREVAQDRLDLRAAPTGGEVGRLTDPAEVPGASWGHRPGGGVEQVVARLEPPQLEASRAHAAIEEINRIISRIDALQASTAPAVEERSARTAEDRSQTSGEFPAVTAPRL